VEDLHRIVNGGAGTLPLTLGPVAAYIPGPFATRGARFDMDEQETIRRFVGSSEGYRRIFLGEQGSQRAAPVVHQLDTILTAVGPSSETPIGYGLDDAATAAGLDKTRLSDLTVGNIGGVFLPREELRDTDRATVLDLNRRWSGVKKQHLRRCDENARRTGAPGVIVFAIGKAKAEIVYECVRLRLVTQLVIDIDLAGELVRHQGCVP
jgi:DNA-binding transcriptional regulator LsrR (DeoR family)